MSFSQIRYIFLLSMITVAACSSDALPGQVGEENPPVRCVEQSESTVLSEDEANIFQDIIDVLPNQESVAIKWLHLDEPSIGTFTVEVTDSLVKIQKAVDEVSGNSCESNYEFQSKITIQTTDGLLDEERELAVNANELLQGFGNFELDPILGNLDPTLVLKNQESVLGTELGFNFEPSGLYIRFVSTIDNSNGAGTDTILIGQSQ